MANEAVWTTAAQVTLEASGASCANAVFVAADDTTISSTNHSNFPYADFAFKSVGTGAALSSAGSVSVHLYEQPLDFDTASGDEPDPSASLRSHYRGSFNLPLSAVASSTYYCQLEDVQINHGVSKFWLENALGQSLNAGWTLKVTPKTVEPAA